MWGTVFLLSERYFKDGRRPAWLAALVRHGRGCFLALSSQASAEASQCCKRDEACELKKRDRLLIPGRHFSRKAVAAAPKCGRSGFKGL